jgi:small toxic polypeptide LdrA/B/C/D
MTYVQLAAIFVGVAIVAAALLTVLSRRNRAHFGAIAVTVAALFLLTAIFDTVMIASGLFHYSAGHLLGIHIGLAPLEDFTYPLAGAVLLPTLWSALRARRRVRGAADAEDVA